MSPRITTTMDIKRLTLLIGVIAGLLILAGCGGSSACVEKYATCTPNEKCCDGFVCQPVGSEYMCLPAGSASAADNNQDGKAPSAPTNDVVCKNVGESCAQDWNCCWTESQTGMWCDNGKCSDACVPSGEKCHLQTAASCCSHSCNGNAVCD